MRLQAHAAEAAADFGDRARARWHPTPRPRRRCRASAPRCASTRGRGRRRTVTGRDSMRFLLAAAYCVVHARRGGLRRHRLQVAGGMGCSDCRLSAASAAGGTCCSGLRGGMPLAPGGRLSRSPSTRRPFSIARHGRRAEFGQHDARLRPALYLLAADVVVAVGSDIHVLLGAAHQGRAQEHHQVGLFAVRGLVLEQVADDRDVAQAWHFFRAVAAAVVDQAAEHDDLAVVDQHIGLDRRAWS